MGIIYNSKYWKKSDEHVLQRLGITIAPTIGPKAIILRWAKPNPSFVKLNIDGSCLGNTGQCGGGGVIRSAAGDFVAGFSKSYGEGTDNMAEDRALLDGLKLCESLQINQVEVETVSMLILTWWKKKGGGI